MQRKNFNNCVTVYRVTYGRIKWKNKWNYGLIFSVKDHVLNDMNKRWAEKEVAGVGPLVQGCHVWGFTLWEYTLVTKWPKLIQFGGKE